VNTDIESLLRERLLLADSAPRCSHVRPGGLPCRAPALRDSSLCYAHARMLTRRPLNRLALRLTGPGSILPALQEVMYGLSSGQLDPKTAGLMLQSIEMFSRAPQPIVNNRPVPIRPAGAPTPPAPGRQTLPRIPDVREVLPDFQRFLALCLEHEQRRDKSGDSAGLKPMQTKVLCGPSKLGP